jgi:class 3 adenylate cyclase/ligand-binding sensor domain-containing protein
MFLFIILRIKLLSIRRMKKYFILCSLIVFAFLLQAQNELGFSKTTNYHPANYMAYSQNWSVTQDQRGVMYFANGDGVLEYDGNFWNLIKLNNSVTTTFLKIDTSSVIYVGAKSDFGYLYVDGEGAWKYNSLAVTMKEEDANFGFINNIIVSQDKIYFCTTRELFVYYSKTNSVKSTSFDNHGRMFLLGDKIYRAEINTGLIDYSGTTPLPVKNNEEFNDIIIKGVIPINKDSALLYTRNQGLYYINLELLNKKNELHIEAYKTEIDEFINQSDVNHIIRLENGFLAIATMRSGTIILDKNAKIKQVFDISSGLLNSTHNYLFQDKNGSLWIAMDNGIAQIDINSPLTFWHEDSGIKGAVMSIARYNGDIYVGTWQGVYHMNEDKESDNNSFDNHLLNYFTAIDGIKTQCWNLNVIKYNHLEILLASTSNGLYAISTNKVEHLDDKRTYYRTYQSHKDSAVFYGATGNGLTRFKINKSSIQSLGLEKGLDLPVVTIAEDKYGLWLGTEYEGLKRLNYINDDSVEIHHYSENEGLPFAEYTYIYQLLNQTFFTTDSGVFIYNAEKNIIETYNSAFKYIDFSKYFINIISQEKEANVWMQISAKHRTKRMILHISRKEDGSIQHEINSYRLTPSMEILSFYTERENLIWFSGDDGLYRYDLNEIQELIDLSFQALIRRVTITNGDVVFQGNYKKGVFGKTNNFQSTDNIPDIPHKKNMIIFDFSSTNYLSGDKNMFQYYLEGYEHNWSDWTYDTKKEYTNLPPGKYMFRLRTKDVFGNLSEDTNYIFYIEYPWFLRIWALVFYLILLLFVIFIAVRISNWRLIKTKKKLENTVKHRTEKIFLQKKEIEQEKEKSDNLLLNILPAKVADELKNKGFAETKYYESTTVMFTDFKSFTKIAEKIKPKELIQLLDTYFVEFDRICDKNNVEKIKTIGDAYMCVGGVPIENNSHHVDTVLAALEMQRFMKKKREEGRLMWKLRIGIHSGSLIAGVVGKRKFAYDVWGDAVNTASRMEESSEENKVNISESTYKLVKEYFDVESRGAIPVKNKDDIKMYFVKGIKESLSINAKGIEPNSSFYELYNKNNKIDFISAKDYIINRFKTEIDKDLHYHDLTHTLNVYKALDIYLENENISEHESIMLKTAALYHDSGFLYIYDNNEGRAMQLIREILPQFNYSVKDIEIIADLIKKTSLKLEPETKLQKILCDADLDYLGTENYFSRSMKLRKEWAVRGKEMSTEEWCELQVEFLQRHKYYTKTAQKYREPIKNENIQKIKTKSDNV